jgi:hypothetical protein
MTPDLPEPWEAWLAFFAASLPRPVEQSTAPDGSVTFRGGSPGEVIVHLAPSIITVSIFTVRGDFTRRPIVVARPVGYVRWRRVLPDDAIRVVESLIAAARAARLAEFRTCTLCERTWPPEHMADERTCVGCARLDNGIVH